jgi:hypothetical protein
LELVAGSCVAAATGSAGTPTEGGADADGAGGVTAGAGAGDDGVVDGASLADGAVGVCDGVAGDAAASARALFRCAAASARALFCGAPDFVLAIGAGDLAAAALAGTDGRAGAGISAVGSERVSTRASDGCVPIGELMAGSDTGVDGAGAMSARGAVTGLVGATLPPSERDGAKNTYASTASTATTSALAITSAVVDGPLDVSSGTKPRIR